MKYWTRMELFPTEKTNIKTSERILSVLAGSWLLYKSIKQIRKHPYLGIQGTGAGGLLLYRGATGICPINQSIDKLYENSPAISVEESITVNAPVNAVYAFWKELSNLPKFMKHLKSVEMINYKTSLWTANILGGLIKVHWSAKIIKEEPNRYLSWKSLDDSMIETTGRVEFRKRTADNGTELRVEINYQPPGGKIGAGIASIFSDKFEQMIRSDIQQFKIYVESPEFKAYSDQVNEKEINEFPETTDSSHQ